jgi:hypothetical protein
MWYWAIPITTLLGELYGVAGDALTLTTPSLLPSQPPHTGRCRQLPLALSLSPDSLPATVSPSPVRTRGREVNLRPSPSLLQSDSALSHLPLGRSPFACRSRLTSCSQDCNELGLGRHGALRVRQRPWLLISGVK